MDSAPLLCLAAFCLPAHYKSPTTDDNCDHDEADEADEEATEQGTYTPAGSTDTDRIKKQVASATTVATKQPDGLAQIIMRREVWTLAGWQCLRTVFWGSAQLTLPFLVWLRPSPCLKAACFNFSDWQQLLLVLIN